MAEEKATAAPPIRCRPSLILGGVAAPLALAGYHFFSYAAMPWVCLYQKQPLLWLAAGLCILLAAVGVVAGFIASSEGRGAPEDAPGPQPRGAFMGAIMALFSALLLLILLAQAAATIILDACQK